MPRDGSGNYNVPSGTYGVEDSTIESARYNAFVDDVAQDLNHPRPIVAGGTGATSADDAMTNLGGELAEQTIVNYDSDLFFPGSFYSAGTATSAPVAGHAFSGICYLTDNNNIFVEARDQDEGVQPGRKYVRQKKSGVWSTWKTDGVTTIGGATGFGVDAGDMFVGVRGTAPNSEFIVNSESDASGTDLLTVQRSNGRVTGNGTCPPGALMDFATPIAPAGWLVCDGQAVDRTTYADLFAAIGTVWGAGDGSATFNLPPLTGRFRRHRDNSVLAGAVGTLKAPANLSHTHTDSGTTSGESVTHTHTFSGSTGGMNANNPHSHGVGGAAYGSTGLIYEYYQGGNQGGPGALLTIAAANIDHGHPYSGTTSGESVAHTHTFNFTSSAGSADDSEARPLSAAVLTCIKY
jgi:microcystin-dependent protein